MNNFVAIGDMILDIYHDNTSGLLGYFPGGSAWNDLLNITSLDNTRNCYCVGTCGDDWVGNFILDTMTAQGIDSCDVVRIPKQTKRFNVIVDSDKTKSQLECPVCKETIWYSNAHLPQVVPVRYKSMTNGAVIIDSLRKGVLSLAKAFKQEGWFLSADIGYINHLRYMSKENIKAIFSNTFDLLQTNVRVCRFLMNKFGFNDEIEVYSFLECKYFIVTDGAHGSKLIYRDASDKIIVVESASVPVKVVDTTGAGDAFFSKLLISLDSNGCFEDDVVSIVQSASIYAADRVSIIGANGKYEKIVVPYSGCKVCGSIIKTKNPAKVRQQKISTNTNHLLDRILRALESDAMQRLKEVLCSVHNQVLMVGTGGSFAAADFVAKLINQYHDDAFAVACKPRDVIVSGLKKVNTVFLFSYSGKTKDIQNVYDLCRRESIPVYVITKFDPNQNEGLFDASSIISYNASRTNTKERGFISMAGTLIPMCLFAAVYFGNNVDDFRAFLRGCFEKRSTEFSNEQYFFNLPSRKLSIDIFSGADTSSAAIDLESKFIESGLGRVVIHEKKDFSHGRFNIIEKYAPDLIIFLDNETGTYSGKLFQYLEKRDHLYICNLKTDFLRIWGALDLVIAAQFFSKYISKITDYDMATPDYPEDAMILYRYSRKDLL